MMATQDDKVGMSQTTEDVGLVTVGETQLRRMSITVPNLDHITEDASKATKAERAMTLREGIRLYPKAIFWSMILSTSLVMEGFDTILINNLFAYDPFKKQYGHLRKDGTYELSAAWQSGLANGIIAGEIIGLFVTGLVSERLGYRKMIIGALAAVTAFIFIPFFATSIVELEVGEILLGIPWGVFQTITTTYAAEVCPVALRAHLTTYVNLCWVMGQLLASGVLRGMISRNDQWGYRIPFALQWIWPIPIAIGTALAPESPWWHVRHGRKTEAKAALLRLTSLDANPNFNADETIAMMEHTNALEKSASAGTRYRDCFKGVDFRRTEIVCVVWAIQTLCGATFMGYSTYFYEQAGLAKDNAFTLTMAQFALGVIGTVCSWFLMQHIGRRTLYLWGQVLMTAFLLVIGFLGLISRKNEAAQWVIGSLLLVYTFTYNCTVGPVCYSLVAELSSTRLRAKTIVLARNLFNISGIVANVLTPRMLNPTAWDWGAKSGFFWAGTCLCCAVWTYFRLPEPKGRTFGELDVLFERHVPARKFKYTAVDPFMTREARRVSVEVQSRHAASTEKDVFA